MQIMITHGRMARVRILQLGRLQLTLLASALLALMLLLSGAIYHFVFLTAAREGWPVVSQLVRLVVRDEIEQRDRYMRENLEAMARRVGEMQAKVVQLEAVGDRVSGLAGLKPDDLKAIGVTPARAAEQAPARSSVPVLQGRGGPYVPVHSPSLGQLNALIADLEVRSDVGAGVLALAESRLSEERLRSLMVPSMAPVQGPVGSGFGFREDPFTGRAALHTGLDFPADPGTPIHAAAGGVVMSAEVQPAYGLTVELDHGKGLVTRYGHASAVLVKAGDLIRRGQPIARVGSSGRSTGPHLHFEVLLDGVAQDPARFLAAGDATPAPGREARVLAGGAGPAKGRPKAR